MTKTNEHGLDVDNERGTHIIQLNRIKNLLFSCTAIFFGARRRVPDRGLCVSARLCLLCLCPDRTEQSARVWAWIKEHLCCPSSVATVTPPCIPRRLSMVSGSPATLYYVYSFICFNIVLLLWCVFCIVNESMCGIAILMLFWYMRHIYEMDTMCHDDDNVGAYILTKHNICRIIDWTVLEYIWF